MKPSEDWLVDNKDLICRRLQGRLSFGRQPYDDIVFEVAIIIAEETNQDLDTILSQLDERLVLNVLGNCV